MKRSTSKVYLTDAKCIMFWIPRELYVLPGFTTNIEFGRWCTSGKIVVGWLPGSPKMRYIDYYTKKLDIPTSDTLNGTIKLAVKMARENVDPKTWTGYNPACKTCGLAPLAVHIDEYGNCLDCRERK